MNIQHPDDWQVGYMAQEVEATDRPAIDFVIDGHRALEADRSAGLPKRRIQRKSLDCIRTLMIWAATRPDLGRVKFFMD